MKKTDLPIAIYYEHPDWFRPLFKELDERAVPYVRIDARSHSYDLAERERRFGLLFNRMSASAYLRDHGHGILFTRDYLAYIESIGTRVINGRDAFEIEISKVRQLALLQSLGLASPTSWIVNCAAEIPKVAARASFPIVIKPNVGGRGAGIVRLNSEEELERALATNQIDFGIDHTALVQEFIPARGGHITRVETLGGNFLYAMKVFTADENFNLCLAEMCQTERAAAEGSTCLADGPRAGLKIEPYTPSAEIVSAVERIVAMAKIDVGGVEYFVDDRDGRILFYDINALSNFVADAPRLLGFNPHARLVDYLIHERDK